ncbi:hypothetical protein BDB01DRAFT_813934 [Pilobolus umbonatus]|nr:hypothetical protein BDB01DRAFT_813934 [Pilobolus umbonatus]
MVDMELTDDILPKDATTKYLLNIFFEISELKKELIDLKQQTDAKFDQLNETIQRLIPTEDTSRMSSVVSDVSVFPEEILEEDEEEEEVKEKPKRHYIHKKKNYLSRKSRILQQLNIPDDQIESTKRLAAESPQLQLRSRRPLKSRKKPERRSGRNKDAEICTSVVIENKFDQDVGKKEDDTLRLRIRNKEDFI